MYIKQSSSMRIRKQGKALKYHLPPSRQLQSLAGGTSEPFPAMQLPFLLGLNICQCVPWSSSAKDGTCSGHQINSKAPDILYPAEWSKLKVAY
jgi:hypothetical protein